MGFKQGDSLPSWQQQLQLLTCSQAGRELNQREKKKEDNPSLGSRKHNTSYSKNPANTGLVLGQGLLPPSVPIWPTAPFSQQREIGIFQNSSESQPGRWFFPCRGGNKKKNLPGYTSPRCDKNGHGGWPLTQGFHRGLLNHVAKMDWVGLYLQHAAAVSHRLVLY